MINDRKFLDYLDSDIKRLQSISKRKMTNPEMTVNSRKKNTNKVLKCGNCSATANHNIKTIGRRNKKIHFCSIECFEKKNI
jgi:hypothetical protein